MTNRPMKMMALILGIFISLSACGTARAASAPQAGPGTQAAQTAAEIENTAEEHETMLQMKIGETKVKVNW